MTKIAILGSTGSIGRNCLEVIARSKNKWQVVGLSAGRNWELFRKQVEEFNPKIISLEREEDVAEFRREYPDSSAEIFHGQDGAEAVARYEECDIVLSAITGINGLRPTLGAVQAGKRLALANKESLVMGGKIIMEEARKKGIDILPIDSEHCAIFQAMVGHQKKDVHRLILTASGGPFLHYPVERLHDVAPEEALKHPRWDMGKKVTIDSATLMNK